MNQYPTDGSRGASPDSLTTISVSVIIPNRNGEATISSCLEAALASGYENFEVIVVDDFSADRSINIIQQFPCRVIPLKKHSGASRARNVGAEHSSGDILFFTDADCLLNKDSLEMAVKILSSADPKIILGGTYTSQPADDRFFSCFQSAFIRYSESKNAPFPDYVATHAMIICANEFKQSGGFAEDYIPILEDIEFSHRMRRDGYRLVLDPAIQVRHIFGYSLAKSMQNAFSKSMYWSAYSINNKDLFKDSGTASLELKLNTIAWLMNGLILILYVKSGEVLFLFAILLVFILNFIFNRGLLKAFHIAGGASFLFEAIAYYMLVYPVAVAAGGIVGLLRYLWLKKSMGYSD